MTENKEEFVDIQAIMLDMRLVQQKSKAFIDILTSNDVLSQNHITLLMDLKLNGSMRITEIAERFIITAGAATSMCDKLEEQQLVCRIRSKEDRRVVMVALTREGEEKVHEIFTRIPAQKLRTISHVFKQVNELMSQIID
ncbi:MarR family transcriptional regulator [Paenibacillus sp. SC116]|uniref:MarR family winged helix-turn-helix transcriptional regulator n=1 Tax=Paenibacillus sp. SC116 TaxID=2968986 RepID=UPI00215A93D4|nr:MarR family transcriptional regulator [Paenibacillus sp. SC116]MCR8843568.1 MarR family transcriptional regulator [Paenibacillus sp. SC116]